MLSGRRLAALVLACFAAAISACGGEGDDPSRQVILKDAPKPAESLKKAEERFRKATQANTCDSLESLVHSQYRSQSAPGGPLTPSECRSLQQKFKPLKGFEASGSQAFQTAAVVDGKIRGDSTTVVFALDTDRRWKFVALLQAAAQAGTPNNALDEFDSSAKAFVAAFRGGSCSTLYSLVSISSPYYGADEKKFCRQLLSDTKQRTSLAYQLKKDPGAKPQRLGGTHDFAFYGLKLKSGRYDTLFMMTQPKDAPAALVQKKSLRAFYEILSAQPPLSAAN